MTWQLANRGNVSALIVRSATSAVGILMIATIAVGAFRTASAEDAPKVFRAGAYAIDITPLELPVIVNGGMLEGTANKVEDRLHARCLVLNDGKTTIAFAVVDSCMMPRSLLDDAKKMAEQETGIPMNRILISATHTHSAPSVHGCLGSEPDPKYSSFLPGQIAKGIAMAHQRMVPAKIGWAIGRDEKNVASRRWLMRPGSAPSTRFTGMKNDRAMMHPGPDNPNAIGATAPVDTEVPVVAVQTADGKPLCVLSNYSMHYVGAPALSADYFAVVCDKVRGFVGADADSGFVGIHSNGTSGDAWLMDYTKPRRKYDRFSVGEEVATAAYEAYKRIKFADWAPIVMEETLLDVGVRMPSAEEVAEAKEFAKVFEGRKPKTTEEVYARETLLISQMPPTRQLKLQAIRIGELGIVAIPNEVFSITGVTIKSRSPLKPTFVIELANGAEGYVPPPEQLKLGGYETWRARTSCLDGEAEPRIVKTCLELLHKVQ